MLSSKNRPQLLSRTLYLIQFEKKTEKKKNRLRCSNFGRTFDGGVRGAAAFQAAL